MLVYYLRSAIHLSHEAQLGHLLVLPVEQPRKDFGGNSEEDQPILLLAMNADESVNWKDMEHKVRSWSHD